MMMVMDGKHHCFINWLALLIVQNEAGLVAWNNPRLSVIFLISEGFEAKN